MPDLALRMWLVHNNALLDFARAHPGDVLAVSFDMLRRGFPVLRAINQRWSLSLEEIETAEIFDQGVTSRGDIRCAVADEGLIGEVLSTWENLERLSRETEEVIGAPVKRDIRVAEEAFYGSNEAYTLFMEKAFLDFEVQFLESNLREAEASRHSLETRLEEERSSLRKMQARLEEAEQRSLSSQRKSELERAESDLNTIIKRMARSRLAPIFRLKQEFRELERKYLGRPANR